MDGIVLSNIYGAGDAAKYYPFDSYVDTTVAAADTYETVYQVASGKGLLTLALAEADEDYGYIKITVDGVVKVTLKSGTAKQCGVCKLTDIQNVNNSSTAAKRRYTNKYNDLDTNILVENVIKPYPTTDSSQAVILLDYPIFFNTSLKIEVKSTTISHHVLTQIRGALHI